MVNRVRPHRQIYLVDPHPDEYSEVMAHLAGRGIPYQFVLSINDAISISPPPGALWLVNHQLYELGGQQLLQHLDATNDRYQLLCVGSHRDPSTAPRNKLPVPYVGKPLLPFWFSHLLM